MKETKRERKSELSTAVYRFRIQLLPPTRLRCRSLVRYEVVRVPSGDEAQCYGFHLGCAICGALNGSPVLLNRGEIRRRQLPKTGRHCMLSEQGLL